MRVAKSLENAKPEIPSIRDRHFAVVRRIAWSSSFVTQKKGVTENERQKQFKGKADAEGDGEKDEEEKEEKNGCMAL